MNLQSDGEFISNPVVYFDDQTPPPGITLSLDGNGFKADDDDDFFLTKNLDDPNCDLVPVQRGQDLYDVTGILNGEYCLFDPRFVIRDNTLENPLQDGGADYYLQTKLSEQEKKDKVDSYYQVQCSNARMTFLNEEYCQLSYQPDTCSQRDPPDVFVDLVEDTFHKIYEASNDLEHETRYVYAFEGLRQELENVPYDPPCTPGETSRWVPVSGDCIPTQVQGLTNAAFASLIAAADDENPYLRDVAFPSTGVSCHGSDMRKFDFQVKVNDQCWRNVHQYHLQVFDISAFVKQHPGGKEAISKFANASRTDNFRIAFPEWHTMDRFYGWTKDFRTEVGRLGDTIRYSELPSSLQSEDIALGLGAAAAIQSAGPTVVCGSPNEIKNRLRNGGNRHSGAFDAVSSIVVAPQDIHEQRLEIWLAIALSGQDALRQRVAWILSQILVISPGAVPGDLTEAWMVSSTRCGSQ